MCCMVILIVNYFFLTWSTKKYYSKPFPWEVRMTLLRKMSQESLMLEWDFWGSTLFYRVGRTGVLLYRWVFLLKFPSRKSFPHVPRGVSPRSLLSYWPPTWNHHSVGHQFPSSRFRVLFVCFIFFFNSTQSRTALWRLPIIIILFGQPCDSFSCRWYIIFSVYHTRGLIILFN